LKKITAVKFNNIFGSKIANYLNLGLHQGRTSYTVQEKPSALKKRTSSTSKHENSLLFLYLWVIFALLDPDPDPATQSNEDPDP
jgi:hypothetical protein